MFQGLPECELDSGLPSFVFSAASSSRYTEVENGSASDEDFEVDAMQSTLLDPAEIHADFIDCGDVVPKCTGDISEFDNGVNLESEEDEISAEDEDEDEVSADYDNEFQYGHDDYVSELAARVLKYLSSQKNKTEFLFNTLYGLYGERLNDGKVRSWLQRPLGISKDRFESRFMSWKVPSTKKGRPFHSNKIRQQVFDLWIKTLPFLWIAEMEGIH